MFGTNERFTLRQAVFTREASFWAMYEDFKEPVLGVTVIKDGVFLENRQNVLILEATLNGAPVPYTYYSDESLLRMDTAHGTVEFCMDGAGQLRIRGRGVGLRMRVRAEKPFGSTEGCRGVYPTADGAWEADFGYSGKILFVPLDGAFLVSAPKDGEGRFYERVVFDFLPDVKNGAFEAVLHEYMTWRGRDRVYESFDAVRGATARAFEDFVNNNLKPPAKGWEELYRYAAYTVWSHRTAVCGAYLDTMAMYQQIWGGNCMGWQQSYNAMPMLKNPAEGWRLIRTLFAHQRPSGQIPGSVAYYGAGSMGMQPAFQGLALDWLIHSCGEDFLTPESCGEMYPRFTKWLNFWLKYRNAGYGDDRVYIINANESGWDDASEYVKGFPVETPDLYAFMILMMDCAGVLARRSGRHDEAESWTKRARALNDRLCGDLWNGERFFAYLTNTGEHVDSLSLATYQALVLGDKRIPKHISDKLAESVMSPDYLTDIGLTTESLKSPYCHFGYNFVLGRVITPCNMLTAVGLYRCGKREEAREICRNVCSNLLDKGLLLGFQPFDYEPTTGEPVVGYTIPSASDVWPWSAWAASSCLVMLTGILPDD
ncbi:MAG: hypothetical protein LBS51_06700 [Oscillospiraceae bacterium]|jgi:hypothetical protein|nr:hypothetical protein [Oscillospiraceae bacterium]